MGKLTLSLTVLFLFVSGPELYSQGELKDRTQENSLSFGVQSGLTLHTDYMINREVSSTSYNINYFEGGINYKFTKNFEAGISYGRNDFTVKRPHVSRTINHTTADTTYDTTQSFVLRNFNYLTLNLTYHFGENLFAGLKGGPGERSGILIGGNIGTNLLYSDEWELNALAQVFTRFETEGENKDISYQVNLLFNVRFKPDLSGIF